MLRDEILALQKATPQDLRKFGLVVGGVFCAVAGLFLLPKWHKAWYWWPLLPGVPLVVLGAVAPRTLKWVNMGWMTLAMVLGAIVSSILLTLMFYCVLTPLGFLARFMGKDFLSLKLSPDATSYWILRDPSKRKRPGRHEQQF